MKVPSARQAIKQVTKRLAELVDINRSEVRQESSRHSPDVDSLVKAGPFTFAVEWKASGAVAPVASAIEQLLAYTESVNRKVIPLLAVPFMGDVGREQCADAKVSWLDLSGNAQISVPGLRILIEGKPNLYKRRGRPSSVFAPKSSRIVRWLLMHPQQPLTQREIARETQTDEGYTSKVVNRLEEDGFIVRDEQGAVRPLDPNLLLEAWWEAYDFSKHHLIKGHVAARSGELLLRKMIDELGELSVPHAVTGLAAAWMLDRFASFRIATLYIREEPSPRILKSLSFRGTVRGANVWLVVPNDSGVFHGTSIVDGVQCVHPVQTYLDLKYQPERAKEAADNLRSAHLSWSFNG